jgi:hypothetical protein
MAKTKIAPKRRGRPAKARKCRTKGCPGTAVTGLKICQTCETARAQRKAYRAAKPKTLPAPAKPLTRRALDAQQRRASARLQADAKETPAALSGE